MISLLFRKKLNEIESKKDLIDRRQDNIDFLALK